MSAEALNCPNCGAAVESDRSVCEHCKARLKTVACSSCLALMFVGAQFCDKCGAIAAPVIEKEQSVGACPRCRDDLESVEIGGTHLSACGKCDGIWMGAAAFENICSAAESQSAVLSYLARRTMRPVPTKIAYVPCPECGELMNRNNFARASGVIVDMCKQHGVWFDADELPAIIEFIKKGGMDLARQREKNDIVDEKSRLRDRARDKSRLERRLGRWDRFDDREPSAIRNFVRSLFSE